MVFKCMPWGSLENYYHPKQSRRTQLILTSVQSKYIALIIVNIITYLHYSYFIYSGYKQGLVFNINTYLFKIQKSHEIFHGKFLFYKLQFSFFKGQAKIDYQKLNVTNKTIFKNKWR